MVEDCLFCSKCSGFYSVIVNNLFNTVNYSWAKKKKSCAFHQSRDKLSIHSSKDFLNQCQRRELVVFGSETGHLMMEVEPVNSKVLK